MSQPPSGSAPESDPSRPGRPGSSRDVVLVGGGHAHVQVLRRWAMSPPRDVRLSVVLDRPTAVYSGMVPGFVAGDHPAADLEIDVVPLARRARAAVILSPAVDLDPVHREIHLADRPPLRFDLASLDVGSTVRGLELPGVAPHALATRPIGRFVSELDHRIDALRDRSHPRRVLVVGGGAAGTEIAFTLEARLRERGTPARLTVLTGDAVLLADAAHAVRARVEREATTRGIERVVGRRVVRVDAQGVEVVPVDAETGAWSGTDGIERLEADLVVWATGAAPVEFPRGEAASRLPVDGTGFLEVRDTLQCVGFDDVFAAGDCARLVAHRWVPRAGVYAVRQGPILERNLRARLEGRPLVRYRPQRDFLSLLNLGGRRALGAKWGLALTGPVVWRLKDCIDRRFVDRFVLLDAEGRPRPGSERVGATDDAAAGERGGARDGAAAARAAARLRAALDALAPTPSDDDVLVGPEDHDGVAVIRSPEGGTRLHDVTVVPAFGDDPWLVGRAAATHALGRIYATGGRPRSAQVLLMLPDLAEAAAREVAFQALSGIRAALDPLGVSLLGGDATSGDALWVALAIEGTGPPAEALLHRRGARTGDPLVLTRSLGSGIVLAADRRGRARGDWVAATHAALLRPAEGAGRLAFERRVHAATHVGVAGLAAHALSLLEHDGLVARIQRRAVPLRSGAAALWRLGLRSTAAPLDDPACGDRIRGADAFDRAWLFDPATAGALLLAVDASQVEALLAALADAGEDEACIVGEVVAPSPDDPAPRGRIELVDGSDESPSGPAAVHAAATIARP